jgi:hypothetical protein
MVIEIVSCPINSMVDLSSSLCKRLPGRVPEKNGQVAMSGPSWATGTISLGQEVSPRMVVAGYS